MILYSVGKFRLSIRILHLLIVLFAARGVVAIVMLNMLMFQTIIVGHQVGRDQIPEALPSLSRHLLGLVISLINHAILAILGLGFLNLLLLVGKVSDKARRLHRFFLLAKALIAEVSIL